MRDWTIGGYFPSVFRVARLSLVPRLDYLDRVQYITHLPIHHSSQQVLQECYSGQYSKESSCHFSLFSVYTEMRRF